MQIKLTGFADEIAQELDVQIAGLKSLDMSYVEMRGVDGNNLIYHTDDKVREIKNVLDHNGIRLSALGSPLGKIGILDDFEKHFEEYKRAVEIGHMMSCPRIRMFSFYIPEGASGKDYEGAVFERIGRFVDYAKENETLLLHENEKGIYGDMAEGCRRLMQEFYGENFKAIFDFANFVQCKQDTLEAYRMLKDYIAYIHVKDAMLVDGSVVPAGYGDGNVEVILKDLFDEGFEGFLSLEPHLSDFTGFELLEKDGLSIARRDAQKLSGIEAFTMSRDALIAILKRSRIEA